jgi:thymidylate synthase (FAD)
MKDEFYVPSPEHILPQSKDNKQGRAGDRFDTETETALVERFRTEQAESYRSYGEMLDGGMARELARINLPLSLYTEWYWQIDLHNLFHFLRLRMDPHAQYEIRVYADAMGELCQRWVPHAWEAFCDYRLEAASLSRQELLAVKALLRGESPDYRSLGISAREQRELFHKLDLPTPAAAAAAPANK